MVRIRSDQSLEYLNTTKYYHYCKISSQSLDNVFNNKIWLSHPASFNDPFDSKLLISDPLIDETVLKLLSKYLISRNNDIENFFSYDSLKSYFSSGPNYTPPPFTESINFAVLDSKDKLKELNDLFHFFKNKGLNNLTINTFFSVYLNMGIFCFSKSFYSPQMWSYYADDHKGMCIEYDFKESIPEKYYLQEIDYSNKYLDTIKIRDFDSEINILNKILSQICYKSTDWCHENEVRFIAKNITESLIENPANISGICLGLRSSESDINIVKNLFKNTYPDVDIYKAALNENYYSIDWESIPGYLPLNKRSYSEFIKTNAN